MSCNTPYSAERRRWLQHALAGCAVGGVGGISTTMAHAAPPNASHPLLPGSRLLGQGSLRFLGQPIYHAWLWVPQTLAPEALSAWPTTVPLLLELQYLRPFSGTAIAQRSLREMQRQGALPAAQAQRWLGYMQALFPDVRDGDRLVGVKQPGQGSLFWHNQRPQGQVPDPEFGERFFGIWLSSATSEPALRRALLALNASSR